MKLYIYGGASFTSNFDEDFTVFYNDTWVFDFSTQTWTFLGISPAGTRGGMGCDAINTTAILMTHGALGHGNIFLDDTWIWDIQSNTWTQQTTSVTKPVARFEAHFVIKIILVVIVHQPGKRKIFV